MKSSRIRFRVADSHLYPSHVEWLLRDGIDRNEVVGGLACCETGLGAMAVRAFSTQSPNGTPPD
jgi:hypothetical protein